MLSPNVIDVMSAIISKFAAGGSRSIREKGMSGQ
jgi:hypothetical protein